MQDSPLSIAASVAGILTFIAAVLAFIYVRYNTLRNGQREMLAILESVSDTIEETRATMAQITTQSQDRPESGPLIKLATDLYLLETGILNEYMRVYGVDLSPLLPYSHPHRSQTWHEVEQAFNVAQDHLQRSRDTSRLKSRVTIFLEALEAFSVIQSIFAPNRMSITLTVIKFVLTLGKTPILLRWYMVRDKVLEMVRQRETLRSRLLFHQISVVNS